MITKKKNKNLEALEDDEFIQEKINFVIIIIIF